MKRMKRFFAVFLASFIFVTTTVCSYIDVQAADTSSIAWTEELLYTFELLMASEGVSVASKAVPGVALAWEAQAKANSPEVQARIAEMSQMSGWENFDTDFGHTTFAPWVVSVRDFFNSDACSGYGTADFAFSSGLMGFINDVVGEGMQAISTRYNINVSSVPGCYYAFSHWFQSKQAALSYDERYIYYDVYIPDGRDIICFYSSAPSTSTIKYVYRDSNGKLQDTVAYTAYSEYAARKNQPFAWSYNEASSTGTSAHMYSSYCVDADLFWQHFPYPVFYSYSNATSYANTGQLNGLLHMPEGFDNDAMEKLLNVFPDLQAEALVNAPTVSPGFVIPETDAERKAVLADVKGADGYDALVKALADAGILVGSNTGSDVVPDIDIDVDVDTYPWLGSIVKYLSSILSAINALPVKITTDIKALLSSILSAINGLADKLITDLKALLISLFVPSGDYFNDRIDSLLTALKAVLPYTVYLDLLETMGNFSGGNLDDITITIMGATATIVSFKSLRDVLPTIQSWTRGVFFVWMVIYHINQIYKLLRNTRIIDGIASMASEKE